MRVTDVAIHFAKTCPQCGWEVVSPNGLKVLDCLVCGQELISFGPPVERDVDVKIVVVP